MFFRCTLETPPIPTSIFYIYVILLWHYGTDSYWQLRLSKAASATVKQPSMLLNICTFKIKINSKHFTSSRMAPKHWKWQIFIYAKISLLAKKTKARLKWPHLPSGRFMKVFYETTTSPRRPLLSGLKGGFFIQVWLYSQQICQHGKISWRTPTHKVPWFFDHVVLWSHVTY